VVLAGRPGGGGAALRDAARVRVHRSVRRAGDSCARHFSHDVTSQAFA
jgi:hypothetical protein